MTKSQQTTLVKFLDAVGDLDEPKMANLVKWVEMYISASDVPDFVAQFDEIKERLAKQEKRSGQNPEKSEDIQKKGGTIAVQMMSAMGK